MVLRGRNWPIPRDETLVPVHLSFWTDTLHACVGTGKELHVGDFSPFQFTDAHPGRWLRLPCREAAGPPGRGAPCVTRCVARGLRCGGPQADLLPGAKSEEQCRWLVGIQLALLRRKKFRGFACLWEENLTCLWLQLCQLVSGKAYKCGGTIFIYVLKREVFFCEKNVFCSGFFGFGGFFGFVLFFKTFMSFRILELDFSITKFKKSERTKISRW